MATRKTATAASKTPSAPASASPARKASRAAAAQPRGLSLHIGLNSVSPAHYGGWSGDLSACEYDALDLCALAQSKGIKPTLLLTRNGTRAKVLAGLRSAAKALKSGDFFLLTFSGHGGQVTDINDDEADGMDETWCLYDSQLIDDELYYELSRFAAGVRILVLSDSCHSGTVTRAALPSSTGTSVGPRPRLMPPAVARRVYRDHQAFYDKLQNDVAKAAGNVKVDPDAMLATLSPGSNRITAVVQQFKPAVVLISGCMDNQTSMDGEQNGAFTERLLAVWKNGAFKGNYRRFHKTIVAGMEPTQTPNLFVLGPATAFLKQQPFTV